MATTHDFRQTDTANARQLINNIDGRVIHQEGVVVGALGGDQRNQQQGEGKLLLNRNTLSRHLFRQHSHGFRDAVLHQHIGHVEIGANLKGNPQGHLTIAGVSRFHIEHVLDTINLLLNRRGDRLLDINRIGTLVGGGDIDHGRGDFGVLGNGQATQGNQA